MKTGAELSTLSTVWVALAVLLLASAPAVAQQTTGTPGSPDATTTISNKQLPPPNPPFGGLIKQDAPILLKVGGGWKAQRIRSMTSGLNTGFTKASRTAPA